MIWGKLGGERGPEPGRIAGGWGMGDGRREGHILPNLRCAHEKLSNVRICLVEGVERRGS